MEKNKSLNICFVIDATDRMQSVFRSLIAYLEDIIFKTRIKNRRINYKYSAVIFRDPIDYKSLISKNDDHEYDYQYIQKLIDKNIFSKDFLTKLEESTKFYDESKYPINKNAVVQFSNEIENIMVELLKVKCCGGNDEPEDWVGGLQYALNEIEWPKDQQKCIIVISDSNAHGKRFCGYDNHNEEEIKMDPIIKSIAEEKILFAGLNIKKEINKGCDQTLIEIEKIYNKYQGPKFIIKNFNLYEKCTNDFLDSEPVPEDIINDIFPQIITKDIWTMQILQSLSESLQEILEDFSKYSYMNKS